MIMNFLGKNRALTLVLVLLLIMGISLAGCAEPVEEPAEPAEEPAEPVEEPAEPAEDPADELAELYDGATVTMAAGPAGSGVDIVARLFARYFEEETGARVLVENYSEIGGLQSMNVVYGEDPDGLTMGCHMGDTTIQNRLLEEEAALYDLEDLEYIGSSSLAPMALWVADDSPYEDAEDFMAASGLLQAGASRLGYMAFWGTLAGDLMGLDFETIIGLAGPPGAKTSVMRDETQFTNIAIHTDGIAPDLRPVVLITDERHDLMPDVPALTEVVDFTDEEMEMLELAKDTVQFGPWFVLPPGTPQDIVDYLRDVFYDITTSEEFIEEAESALGVWGVLSGEEVEEGVQRLIERRDEFEEVRQLVEGYYR